MAKCYICETEIDRERQRHSARFRGPDWLEGDLGIWMHDDLSDCINGLRRRVKELEGAQAGRVKMTIFNNTADSAWGKECIEELREMGVIA